MIETFEARNTVELRASFLCPRCRTEMPARTCRRCGFTAHEQDGILDFLSEDPAYEALAQEIAIWDTRVSEYDTCRLDEDPVSLRSYFRGRGEHRSAARMLPELKSLDLRGKTAMEVGGTGHGLAMMLQSGGSNLYHLEVSRETQRIAMRNLSVIPETDYARITYLNAPAETIPLPDNSLDFLMAFGTYHHTDRRRSVPEIHRVLKPGGMFYFHETYVGMALLPLMWLSRAIRAQYGFNPGNDNPFSRPDLIVLRKYFPRHRYEIRNVLAIPAFVVRYLSPRLASRMYRSETNIGGVTLLSLDFLKGILLFSGMKTS